MRFDEIPLERLIRKRAVCAGGATTLVIPAIPDGYMLLLYNFTADAIDATPVETEVRVLITNRDADVCRSGIASSHPITGTTTFAEACYQPNYPIVLNPGEFLSVQLNVGTSAGEASWMEVLVPITKEGAQ